MEISFHLLRFIVVLLFANRSDGQSEPIATIRSGRIRGSFMGSASGRQFMAFRGIFYAEPPTGDFRFREPVPVKSWKGKILDATREGPTCLQYDSVSRVVKGSEDCLTLNVYTHKLTEDRAPLRPVMVWIHGGSFTMGSGNGETGMFGAKYFLDYNIVLVTVNYRLGPFGFLTTADSDAAGNYGLLDQTLALKWVRRNIESFGGDPDSVTIFGESAGGASVHLHVLSPHSRGLFHKAIAQSGTGLCQWSLVDSVETYTQTLARNLNCSIAPSRDLVSCLRNKTGEEIITQTLPNNFTGLPDLTFGPRIDVERQPSFIPGRPRTLLETGQFNQVPFITGVNENEGAMVAAMLLAENGRLMTNFQRERQDFLVDVMGLKNWRNGKEVAQRTIDQYLDGNKPFDQQLSAIDKMTSDSLFFKCAEETVDLHTKHGSKPTYYYYYTHRGLFTMTLLLGAPPTLDLGVCHGDELLLMFSNAFLPASKTPADTRVSEVLFDLWTSFAAEGQPKSKFIKGLDWLPNTRTERRYLKIGLNTSMVVNKTMPFHERLAFWDRIMDASTSSGHAAKTAIEVPLLAIFLAFWATS